VIKPEDRVGVRTDVGRARQVNEDNYCIANISPPWFSRENVEFLFAVADGMGGHAAGEMASSLAVKTLQRVLSSI